ncbi:MAG TPA: hypothetical protein VIN08_13125 [Ohtaekwangia sp.]|uniref:hypothetical protein n=1 Tax=Ohtaekwangia sp. TaxID=2066019 RepID=UPI002F929FCD
MISERKYTRLEECFQQSFRPLYFRVIPYVMRFYSVVPRVILNFVFILLIHGCTFSQSNTDHVYITRTGAKYHKSTCRYLKYSSYEITLKEAKERGYTACSVCRPSQEKSPAAPVAPQATPREGVVQAKQELLQEKDEEKEQVSEPVSQQCSALTKAGTRCKRMTQNANGKCWQHQ